MITQQEADYLIAMRKFFVDRRPVYLPPGADETFELQGQDKHEVFLLDLWRGTIRLSKIKLQTRARKVIVLVRLDIAGSPHTNPDGAWIAGTHIHLYRQGFEDRWAYPVDPVAFRNTGDPPTAFEDFCHFCNIVDPPALQEVLL
jgi:hypothetical protein